MKLISRLSMSWLLILIASQNSYADTCLSYLARAVSLSFSRDLGDFAYNEFTDPEGLRLSFRLLSEAEKSWPDLLQQVQNHRYFSKNVPVGQTLEIAIFKQHIDFRASSPDIDSSDDWGRPTKGAKVTLRRIYRTQGQFISIEKDKDGKKSILMIRLKNGESQKIIVGRGSYVFARAIDWRYWFD